MLSALRVCWKVVARGRVAWLTTCALLGVVERLSALTSALAWRSSWFSSSVVVFVVAALAHRGLRLQLRVSTTATAFERIVDRVTQDDEVPRDDWAPMAIVEGAHHASRTVADVAVPIVADVVATVAGLVALASMMGSVLVVVGALAVIGVGMATGTLLSRPSERAFTAYLAMIDGVVDAFDGRAELLASGKSSAFARQMHTTIVRWRTSALATDVRGAVVSRLPMLAIVGVAIFVLLARGSDPSLLRHALVLAAVVPAGLGVVRGAHDLSKVAARLDPLVTLFGHSAMTSNGVMPDVNQITWSHVTVAYGDHVVVSEVQLEVKRGTTIALVGPNGAGKTTLLLVALGLRKSTDGGLLVSGVDLRKVDVAAWRRVVNYLPQRPYLLPRRSVRDAMRFPAAHLDDETIEHALRRVRLWERLVIFPGDPLAVLTDSLSAGERQRLALARVLTKERAVYLLDEPDANLDAEGVRDVAELLRTLASAGKIVVVAAHTPEVIAAADRVVHLEAGRVSSVETRNPSPAAPQVESRVNES